MTFPRSRKQTASARSPCEKIAWFSRYSLAVRRRADRGQQCLGIDRRPDLPLHPRHLTRKTPPRRATRRTWLRAPCSPGARGGGRVYSPPCSSPTSRRSRPRTWRACSSTACGGRSRGWRAIPAWARRLGGAQAGDIKRVDDWRRLPFLTKDDLRDAYPLGAGLRRARGLPARAHVERHHRATRSSTRTPPSTSPSGAR